MLNVMAHERLLRAGSVNQCKRKKVGSAWSLREKDNRVMDSAEKPNKEEKFKSL